MSKCAEKDHDKGWNACMVLTLNDFVHLKEAGSESFFFPWRIASVSRYDDYMGGCGMMKKKKEREEKI